MQHEATTSKPRTRRLLQAGLCSTLLLFASVPLGADAFVEEASASGSTLSVTWSTMTVTEEEPDTTERYQGVVLTDMEHYGILDLGFEWSVYDSVARSGVKEARFNVVVERVDLRDPDRVIIARTAQDSTSYTVTGTPQTDSGALQILLGIGDLPAGYTITQQISFWDGVSLDAFDEPAWKTETHIMKLVLQPGPGTQISANGLGLRCFSDDRGPSAGLAAFGATEYQIMTMDQGEGCAIDPLVETAEEQGRHFNEQSSYSCFPLRDFLCLVYVRATAGGGSVDDSFCGGSEGCIKASIAGNGFGPIGTVSNWGKTFRKLHMADHCQIPAGGGSCSVPARFAHSTIKEFPEGPLCATSHAAITGPMPLTATAYQGCW